MAMTIGRRAGTKTQHEIEQERRAAAKKRDFVPRLIRMCWTLVFAAIMAGLSAICLGLVDAGQELDASLSHLEYDVASLKDAAGSAIDRKGAADAMTAPQARLQRALETFPANADRIIGEKTPEWCRPAAKFAADLINLVPNAETLDRAFKEYVEQVSQAMADKAPTPGAVELRNRLLDLKYETLLNKISDARERTRQGINHALTGMQVITLASIGFAALFVGLSRHY